MGYVVIVIINKDLGDLGKFERTYIGDIDVAAVLRPAGYGFGGVNYRLVAGAVGAESNVTAGSSGRRNYQLFSPFTASLEKNSVARRKS